MDPEQTFLRVHARLSGVLSQLLTARIRLVLEYVHLAFAVVLLCLLVVMHANFVQQPGCSSELSGINFTEAQLVQIKISVEQKIMNSQREDNLIESMATPDVKTDGFTILPTSFWSNWIGSGAKRSKLIFKSWKDEKEVLEPQVEKSTDKTASKVKSEKLQKSLLMTTRELFRAVFIRFFSRWNPYISFYRRIAEQFLGSGCRIWTSAGRYVLGFPKLSKMLRIEHLKPFTVQLLASRSKAFEPTYLYTSQKGYFLLPEAAKARHNIRAINVTISAKSSCFGNRLQQLLINRLVGYDTILMNSLLNSPGQGYLYNYQTNEFTDLSYGHESTSSARFGDYFVTKCGILIMSLFVFFTTTMSVSFTLRETQSRMLWFTVQLQHHARHHLPTFQLIFVHVIESLVFVPIMMGILFFLFEFYDDQLLAFLVLALVWLSELFTMISVRTPISMQFFPRFFLLYFLAFHIYFFSFPYGFSYLAFSATLAFMQHLILYFWNRFEVPALQRFTRTRAQLQQQAGVRITSTIYTSTLQITRRNLHIANLGTTGLVNTGDSEDQRAGPEPRAGPTQPTTDTVGPTDDARAQEEVQNPQTEAAPAPGFLNPFSSFLFRILGGASSDGIISFFSMFRVVRDQAQNYTQEQQDDNDEQAT